MKIGLQGSDTEVIGAVGEATEFKIKNSPIAFEILSSRLYNDKISAIIRELSCNAYDAHIAAGKADVPFEIHLPTPYEEYFSIKDYGTGLSHENLLNLYCTYFGSNKGESDDFIGAMGVGSKSPFCYTTENDQPVGFTIISRFEGKTRTYDAHISQAGTPEVILLTEVDSPDEPNGLEISFPVARRDRAEFQNKAQTILEFFNPVPKVNIDYFQVKKTKYALKTSRWGLREGYVNYGEEKVRAIMGKVVYSIGNIDISKMTEAHQTLLSMPLDLFFEIGELQPAVSRETLSNTRKTVDSILKITQELHDTLLTEIKATINQMPTKWQAHLEIKKMKQSPYCKLLDEAIDNGSIFCQYQNFKLDNLKLPQISEFDYTKLTLHSFSPTVSYGSSKKAVKRSIFTDRASTQWQETLAKLAAGLVNKKDYNLTFDIADDVLYVVNDLTEGTERYISYFLADRCGWITREGKFVKTSINAKWGTGNSPYDAKGEYKLARVIKVILISPLKTALQQDFDLEKGSLLRELGYPPTVLASELKVLLPEADEKDTVERIREKKEVMKLHFNGSSFEFMWLKVDPKELPEGDKFYVVVREGKPDVGNCKNWYSAEEFTGFMKHVANSGIFGFRQEVTRVRNRYSSQDVTYTPDLYALKPSSKLPYTTPGWIHFPTYMKKIAADLVSDQNIEKLTLLLSYNAEVSHGGLWETIVEKNNLLNPASPASKFAKKWVGASLHRGNAALNSTLHKLRGLKVIDWNEKVFPDFRRLYDLVASRYPLLRKLHEAEYNSAGLLEYIHYIALIDMELSTQEAAGQVDDEPLMCELTGKEINEYVTIF